VNQKSVAKTCRYEIDEPPLDRELRYLAARELSRRHAAPCGERSPRRIKSFALSAVSTFV
jgi:hypothetical protein